MPGGRGGCVSIGEINNAVLMNADFYIVVKCLWSLTFMLFLQVRSIAVLTECWWRGAEQEAAILITSWDREVKHYLSN